MAGVKNALYFDVFNNKIEPLKIEDSLETMYQYLKCDTIEIRKRKVGNKYYSFVVDENGLFADKVITSAIDSDCQIQFVGNILVFGLIENGELTGLTDGDLCNLINHFRHVNEYDDNHVLQSVRAMFVGVDNE